MTATRIRCGVAGTGSLGQHHARIYSTLPGAELAGIFEPNDARAAEICAKHNCHRFATLDEMAAGCDAVSVVVPTNHHAAVALPLLAKGVHLLIEKPICVTLEEASQILEAAAKADRIVQVGHIEHYNPVMSYLEKAVTDARYITAERLAPFTPRGTEVGVVLDLMIHDIDIVQSIVGRPIESIDAVGTSVFSGAVDIANARLRFAGGCVANVTASRVSMKTERKLRVFRDDAYLSIDLQQRILTTIRKRSGPLEAGQLPVQIDERSFEQADALREEIRAFLGCIRTGRPPVVSGEDGLRALETAIRITGLLAEQHANGGSVT